MSKENGLKLGNYIDVNKPVTEIATKKIHACNEKDNLLAAIGKVLEGADRVFVINDAGEFKGLLTVKDIIGYLSGARKKKGFSILSHVSELARQAPHFEPRHNIAKALEVFKKLGEEVHPVLLDKKLAGIITEMDFVKHINKPTGLKVEDLMVGRPIIAKEHYKLNELAKMMYFGFTRMPVQKNGLLIGMVTPYDILSYLHKNQNISRLKQEKTEVKDFMNKEPVHALAEWDVHKAVELMRAKNVSALPVVEDDFGKLVGIITERDVVDALA